MARHPSFPVLYDEVLALSIGDLKRLGYLVPMQSRSGTITWRRNGQTAASIGVLVEMEAGSGFIDLGYNFRGEPVKYRVHLEATTSNLGKGLVWYFRCPVTGKRCRKLYGVGRYYLHREAFRGGMYGSQTWSKQTREFQKSFGWLFEGQNLDEELRKKYRKRVYRGRPTPLQRKLEKVECQGMQRFLAFEEMKEWREKGA